MGYVKPEECEGCRHWANDYDGCFMARGGLCVNFSYWEKGYYELVAQIEKMKNCHNCKHFSGELDDGCSLDENCEDYNKWRLK